VPNYDNHVVQAIKERLGPYNYEPHPPRDNVVRTKKGMVTLENGAKYEGEWDTQKNSRDGKGM
jgi:hypothetical protein